MDYNGSYAMMAKPMRTLELHYPTILFLINIFILRWCRSCLSGMCICLLFTWKRKAYYWLFALYGLFVRPRIRKNCFLNTHLKPFMCYWMYIKVTPQLLWYPFKKQVKCRWWAKIGASSNVMFKKGFKNLVINNKFSQSYVLNSMMWQFKWK